MRLVIATGNENKLREMKELVVNMPIEVVSQNEIKENIDVDENGTTFLENAKIKALTVSKLCDDLVLADDSGLVIDALNGEPGIYSARYLGHDTPYEEKNRLILERLSNVEMRSARYVCAISICHKGEEVFSVEETLEGEISQKPLGTNGFGYDPIFYYPPLKMGTAEMSLEEKNKISHRGKAMRKALIFLENFVNED